MRCVILSAAVPYIVCVVKKKTIVGYFICHILLACFSFLLLLFYSNLFR